MEDNQEPQQPQKINEYGEISTSDTPESESTTPLAEVRPEDLEVDESDFATTPSQSLKEMSARIKNAQPVPAPTATPITEPSE